MIIVSTCNFFRNFLLNETDFCLFESEEKLSEKANKRIA